METLNKSPAVAGGSFAPTMQIEKLEIHTVFLHFSNFNLGQNLSPSALVDLIIVYLTWEADEDRIINNLYKERFYVLF